MATESPRRSGIHETMDHGAVVNHDLWDYRPDLRFEYDFENFFHPFVGQLIEKLTNESLPGMLDPEFHKSLAHPFFREFYAPEGRPVTVNPVDMKVELERRGAYSTYNWELLFHLPLAIARHLSKNRRFAEARRWFHFIFDPTCNDTTEEVPTRFWRFLAFRDDDPALRIERIVELLSKPEEECSAPEQ